MRVLLCCVVFCICSVFPCTYSFSQQSKLLTRISINCINQPLPLILKEIETKAGIRFFFTSDVVPSTQISVTYSNKPIIDILEDLLPNHAISFQIMGDRIILTKQETPPPQSTERKHQVSAPPIPQPEIIEMVEIHSQDNYPLELLDSNYVDIDSIPIDIIPDESQKIYTVKKQNKHINCILMPYISGNYLIESHTISGSFHTQSILQSSTLRPWTYNFGVQIGFPVKAVYIVSGIGAHTYTWDMSITEITHTQHEQFAGYEEEVSWLVTEIKKPDHPDQSQAPRYDSTKIITRTPIYETIETTSEFSYSKENSAQYISIPLGILYPYHISEKIRIHAALYSHINLLYFSEGYNYSGKATEIEPLTSLIRDYYISISPEIRVSYMISKPYILTLGTSYTYATQSMYKNIYSNTIRVSRMGVSLGLLLEI